MRIVVGKTGLQGAGPSVTDRLVLNNGQVVASKIARSQWDTQGGQGASPPVTDGQVFRKRKDCDKQESNQIVSYIIQGNIRWAIYRSIRYGRPSFP